MSEETKEEIEEKAKRAATQLEILDRLKIDPLALQAEFLEIPRHIAQVGFAHGQAVRNHLRAEVRTKKLWGLVMAQARGDLEDIQEADQAAEDARAKAAGTKAKDVRVRITESMVEGRALQSELWIGAKHDEAEAETDVIIAKANFAAILSKRDALIQLGATERIELGHDATIRKKAREVRDQD